MSQPRESRSLRPVLRQVEAELEGKMEEVCDSEQHAPETTGELIRLEEALSDAAKAAKQAVSLRRRLREESKQDEGAGSAPGSGEAEGTPAGPADAQSAPSTRAASSEQGEAVRHLTDREGRSWRVWAVLPETMKRFTGVENLMGQYRLGWLAFETVDGEIRKRLTSYPDDWQSLPAAGLEQLLDRAETATRRKPGPSKPTDDPHP
jgi:hypothetical protein